MIYKADGTQAYTSFDFDGTESEKAYAHDGTEIYRKKTDYEEALFTAMGEWKSSRTNATVPLIVHTDQHTYLTNNKIFETLLSLDMNVYQGISACLNLGDVTNYNESNFASMSQALSYVPIEKQINIWGNHDTWIGTQNVRTPNAEAWAVLNNYFDNSEYDTQHTYNDYGIQYMIDDSNNIKYVVLGGWEYDATLGRYDYYVIGSQSMDYIIDMLSTADDNDIVIISHIQPYSQMKTASLWSHPPVEEYDPQGGGGSMSYAVGSVATNVLIDDLLNARKNKTSGSIADSYGNVHQFDFTSCTSDLLCCFAGHEHIDKYAWANNGSIPIYIFDSYAYDDHPIYFINIDKVNQALDVWKVDESPQSYNYQIPFTKPVS